MIRYKGEIIGEDFETSTVGTHKSILPLLERAYIQGFTDGTTHERQQTAVNPHDLFENWLVENLEKTQL